MQSCPSEHDEDWGPGSDTDGAEEEAELCQAGGPLRCWQRAGLKRLVIDERRPATVRPARYDTGPCCGVCGRRPSAGHPLAPLFDNTSFVSMADVVRDVVGLEFTASENPHENVVCGGCRGHLLALHTMRGWLCALQKRFARMAVCTNNGRRSAKILMPKAYRGVDFFSREAPLLELSAAGGERLGALDSAVRLGECERDALGEGERERDALGEGERERDAVGEGERDALEEAERDALAGGLETAMEQGVLTSGPVSGQCEQQLVDGPAAERASNESELGPASASDQVAVNSGVAGAYVTQQLLGIAPTVVSESLPAGNDDRPSDSTRGEPLPQPPSQLPDPSQPPPPPEPPASVSQPMQPPKPATYAAPMTPPRPMVAAAAGGGDSELLDPFEEYSISDLLVLRSPLAPRPPAATERPPPAKLKKIAPKLNRREAVPPPPPPIVLNIMPVPVPVPVSGSGSPSFKAIVPRRTKDRVSALPAPQRAASAAVERSRRPPRRLSASSRNTRRPRRAPDAEPPPPQDAAGFQEPMVFYNPDGSIPAPPYSGQTGTAPAGMAATAGHGGASEYAQLQTVQPEPPPPPTGGYRPHAAYEVPHDEIERYAADYAVYMEEVVPMEQEGSTQQQQQQQPPPPQPPPPQQQHPPPPLAAAAEGSSSATNAHQVALEGGRDAGYRVTPRICKPCGAPLSCEMHMVRKHFVESHMSLERNDLTGSIVYRCRVCSAESTSLESLKKHFGTRHVSRSALVCGRCDQPFPRLEALQYHFRRQHQGRSECGQCGVSFPSSRALNVHLSKAHQLERGAAQPRRPPPPGRTPPAVAEEVTVDTTG